MPSSLMRILLLLGIVAASAAGTTMCGNDTLSFEPDEGITDPYCVDTPDWFEKFSVTAEYSEEEPEKVVVRLLPDNDIVDMHGLTDVEGADIDNIVLDDSHTLWLVLIPYEEQETIVIHGAVDCTTLTQRFDLTLTLSQGENSVTYEITFTDETASDAGDAADAGE